MLEVNLCRSVNKQSMENTLVNILSKAKDKD